MWRDLRSATATLANAEVACDHKRDALAKQRRGRNASASQAAPRHTAWLRARSCRQSLAASLLSWRVAPRAALPVAELRGWNEGFTLALEAPAATAEGAA